VEVVQVIFEIFLHLDRHLSEIITQYGVWTYGILFFVIFIETGFVVTPFLPGDSLLFAAGTFAALNSLDLYALIILLTLAAVLGDTTNYWIGYTIGERAYRENFRWLNKKHLDRTHEFFERHGGKTIFLARFVPIVRTFAPFVAGIGRMSYGYFISYNFLGGTAWVILLLLTGYAFGNIPVVKHNFSLAIMGVILISLVPIGFELIRDRCCKANGSPAFKKRVADKRKSRSSEAE